ncbi:hypothetical protein L226DRAFT_614791 [Lentinus tigrinus ALCF2SS1-7]|uniref:Uncharacterized protein n=1 Tax=Lentinus tigrinus ALCF2SS1-6 TaxID=1328759 RepID=A0A5C2RQL5_9APHY|nr:hypothetical protein L227DRAFT_658220 [Lentinus tigrinus ALCF2SS1-6]RPD72648.1 hypothetical protein L226DRAFT_614791 [Lentinus tigrinus ALCF2SS1-7]
MFTLLAAFTFILYVVVSPVANTTPLDLEVEILPSSDTNLRLEKRNIGGVYICSGTNWGGECGYAVQPLDTCIVLGSDWKNKIASFGPDSCTMCFAYKTDNCAFGDGFFWMFQHPGDASGGRSVTNNPWNKHIESFKCWRSPDCYAS